MENIEKETSLILNLKEKHEQIKNEMLKVIEAIQILDNEYKSLEQELYKIEDDYVNIMKNK